MDLSCNLFKKVRSKEQKVSGGDGNDKEDLFTVLPRKRRPTDLCKLHRRVEKLLLTACGFKGGGREVGGSPLAQQVWHTHPHTHTCRYFMCWVTALLSAPLVCHPSRGPSSPPSLIHKAEERKQPENVVTAAQSQAEAGPRPAALSPFSQQR